MISIDGKSKYILVCCEDTRGLREFWIYSGKWSCKQCKEAIPAGFSFVWLTGYETLHEVINSIRYSRNNY